MSAVDMYPTIPALGSLPYDLNTQHQRLLEVYGYGHSTKLTEGNQIVFENEMSRLTDVLTQAQAMVERINGGNKSASDSVDGVRNLISVLSSGIDALNTIVGNGTAMDGYRNAVADVLSTAKTDYNDAKVELENITDKTLGKVTGIAPWAIIILGLVLAIVIFARE